MATEAYRAPLRSRRDDIDAALTFRRALSLGSCGFGGVLRPLPDDLGSALRLAAAQYDERTSARIERFAAVAPRAPWCGRVLQTGCSGWGDRSSSGIRRRR